MTRTPATWWTARVVLPRQIWHRSHRVRRQRRSAVECGRQPRGHHGVPGPRCTRPQPETNLASTRYIAGTTTNNFSANLPFHKDFYSYDIKSDYTITAKDHLSGRFSHQTTNTLQAPVFGSFLGGPAGSGGFEANGTATAYSTGANYEHVFSPTLFTEARVGVALLRNSAQQTDYGTDDARTLGIPGNGPNWTNNAPTSSGQVAFQVSNFANNGENGTGNPLIGYSPSLPWLRAESNIDFANNWTKVLGNHAIKFGTDIRRIRDDLLQGNNNAAAGTFYFSVIQTAAPGATSFNGAVAGQANDISVCRSSSRGVLPRACPSPRPSHGVRRRDTSRGGRTEVCSSSPDPSTATTLSWTSTAS